ncbi:helix-turn-helix domain-containing protein [Acidisoma cellulosilytica]|uniref:Helix-turn-helix domain-containing protein n=1 Tax=Acidisoma cellulosilyticum TaxID=2802395 RepID=A0A963YYR6_9PROT|nr:AraC family transcriptional regulator [Acidisoma cellulosilyticum]MCB8878735.1 helix-turn-helix domain-containing protein [Acidisoma cellulosilyticum]
MKPTFEKITPDDGASWVLLDRRMQDRIPFEWHHHPEYELTLTLNSRGHRYIGNDVDAYDDGDLVFIGPGIPHSWCSETAVDPEQPHIALVVWFTHGWANGLLALFPEMARLRPLLAAASQGVRFGPATRAAVRPKIEAMSSLDPAARLILLFEVLLAVCTDSEAMTLANVPGQTDVGIETDARILRVLDYLHAHFAETVTVTRMADLANVSVSAFHRMFRRHTRMTAVDYITRLRIGRACSFLIDGDLAIAHIAEDVGFQNLSLFNRQFGALKGQTPSAFRKRHRLAIYPAPSSARQKSIRSRD